MKKAILTVIALLLLLSGCGSENVKISDAASHSLDANRAFLNYTSNACVTEDTVYFAVAHKDEPYSYFMLHYMDKATGISGPLCGKSDCEHKSSSCNAYIALDITGLSVYDGKLYWLEDTYGTAGYGKAVVSMELDGTGRREICEVSNEFFSSKSTNYSNFTAYFHRGYLYLSYEPQYIEDGREVIRNCISAFSLDSDGEETVILDEESSRFFKLQLYGDSMYILTGSDFDEITIRRWDIKTGEMESIFDGNLSFRCLRDFWVTDDGIYFDGCVQTGTDESGNKVWQDNLYRYDFASGEFEQVYTLTSRAGVCIVTVSENLFIEGIKGDDSWKVLVKDFDGQTVLDTTVSNTILPLNAMMTIAGADETNLYIYTQVDPESFIVIPLDGSDARVLWHDQL